MRRRYPIATAVLVAWFSIATAPVLSGDPPEESQPEPVGSSWVRLAAGLEMRTLDGGDICRKGPRNIKVVRVDTSGWGLDIFHYKEDGGRGMTDIERWQERLKAPIVFNAGQYYPNRNPMGLFVKEGRNLGTPRLKNWKGILAGPPATIIDLDLDSFDQDDTPYRVLMQSFMILDRNGKKRVRRSDWHANRTLVANDSQGRLLVIHTEGAYTLWELADWLHRSDMDIQQAMSMDGGFEAQMCIRTESARYLSFGSWHVDDRGDHSIPGIRKSLPAVVALFPR